MSCTQITLEVSDALGGSGSFKVAFSMGQMGETRTSANDAPWEMLSQRFGRPIISANPVTHQNMREDPV